MAKKCTTLNKTDVELAQTQTDLDAAEATLLANSTLTNDIRAKLKGDYPTSKTTLNVGSTPANVSNAEFYYVVGGVQYTKAAVAAGTAPGNDIIPQNKYGAVALDINNAGTITVAEAADNSTGYASAALALAGIPAVASGKARMGTVSVIRTAGAFTFGTTSLSDGDTTVVYTDGETHFEAIGAAIS
jgi:hypothetical protein